MTVCLWIFKIAREKLHIQAMQDLLTRGCNAKAVLETLQSPVPDMPTDSARVVGKEQCQSFVA